MFSKTLIKKSITDYSEQIKQLRKEIKEADAIVIGAGAGLSTSAGFTYSGERFEKYFADFIDKYHIPDMYSGGFYPFETLEEYWAWWSRHIYYNRYIDAPNLVYQKLYSLVKEKDYFVLTTNVDHMFQKTGFDKNRLFYTQGDYGLFQCSKPCHHHTYDNENVIREMVEQQRDMKIPSELIPKCPICHKPMTVNLRCDGTFVQDQGWEAACGRYEEFLTGHDKKHILFLELGVGANTPGIIKYSFWQMTSKNRQAVYACINYGDAVAPSEIGKQSICIDGDIGEALEQLTTNQSNEM